MNEARPTRVVVEAPARLHLGFIDLNGGCGRLFGSIGVAVERPRYLVEASSAPRTRVEGEAAGELSRIIEALGVDGPVPVGIRLRVIERIPRHQGLGSGTQRDLALSCAISRLAGRVLSGAQLAQRIGRGRRSGIGVAIFDGGGLVVDGGVAVGPGPAHMVERLSGVPVDLAGLGPSQSAETGELDGPPPVIFQRPLPADWQFVLATPEGEVGLHGPREEAVFRDLPRASEAMVGRISRLVLMKMLPAAATDDIVGFGEVVTEIQSLMGQHFASCQGGPYATDLGRAIAELALKQGAAGVGQSSWGPTVFALVRGAETARELIGAIRRVVGDAAVTLWHTPASPRGAVVRSEPC